MDDLDSRSAYEPQMSGAEPETEVGVAQRRRVGFVEAADGPQFTGPKRHCSGREQAHVVIMRQPFAQAWPKLNIKRVNVSCALA
jgi:hypothetical protein